MKNSFILICIALILQACGGQEVESLQTAKAELEEQVAALKAQLTAAQEAAAYEPGLIHTVFFWLKEDLTDADRAAFMDGVESLNGIASVRDLYVGPVAPTEARGVVDNTFNLALIVHFDDVAGQDAYQIDPVHLKFVEGQKDKWTKVVVYDNLVE